MSGVRFEERDGILLVVLSRPDKLNPLDTETLNTIAERLEQVQAEPKTLLLAAEGRVFSAGIDLAEVASAATPSEAARPFKALGRALRALLGYPAPTLAFVHAPAIAGGAELALAADILIAGPAARLEWPEVRWNIVAPLLTGLAQRVGLPRLVAAALAAERLDRDELLRLGLASYSASSLDEALGIAARIDSLYRGNTAAFARMLPLLRQWKFEALDEILPGLESLAGNMELVERARRFLKR